MILSKTRGMAKKIKHLGMEMTDEEHQKWHDGHREMIPAQHKALVKEMGVGEEEDKKWHEAHNAPHQTESDLGRKSVNPFAIGGGFLDYCIKQGWLIQEGKGRRAKYYATEEGENEFIKFGITI